jgi:hypothetical protein
MRIFVGALLVVTAGGAETTLGAGSSEGSQSTTVAAPVLQTG